MVQEAEREDSGSQDYGEEVQNDEEQPLSYDQEHD